MEQIDRKPMIFLKHQARPFAKLIQLLDHDDVQWVEGEFGGKFRFHRDGQGPFTALLVTSTPRYRLYAEVL